MNFLIFDNELLSLNLIQKCSSEFHYVKLVTLNESNLIPPSPYLSINQGDISNASQVIENLSKHEDDPFDAVLIFNSTLSTSLNNVIQTLQRLKRQSPCLFLIFVNQQNEIDKNIIKILKESFESIQWTIIFWNEINSSLSTKYRIETKFNSTLNQQPISTTDFLNFLSEELKKKNFVNQTVYFY